MLGYTHAALLTTPVSQIPPGEFPQRQDFVARVLHDGHGIRMSLTCRTLSGTYLPTQMALHTFTNTGQVYILALIRDRSEYRRQPPAG